MEGDRSKAWTAAVNAVSVTPCPSCPKSRRFDARSRRACLGARLLRCACRGFGLLRVGRTEDLVRDPSLAELGPDPLADPQDGARLRAIARGSRVAVKSFLMDQRRIAGIGNIYASEILFRAGVDPRRRAGS